MTNIPGFTAESILVGSTTRFRLSPKNYHSNSPSIISEMREASASERSKIIEPHKEPAESGRRAWMDLEKSCNNLQCQECRKECLSFINGLHDAINIKLGKPVRTPNDFVHLRDFVNTMSKYAFSS